MTVTLLRFIWRFDVHPEHYFIQQLHRILLTPVPTLRALGELPTLSTRAT